MELLDGRRLLTQEARSLEGPQRQSRGTLPPSSHETGFIQYLDSGIWHLAFYNDGKESEVVSFLTTAIGKWLHPPLVSLVERKVVDSGVGAGEELELNRIGIGVEWLELLPRAGAAAQSVQGHPKWTCWIRVTTSCLSRGRRQN